MIDHRYRLPCLSPQTFEYQQHLNFRPFQAPYDIDHCASACKCYNRSSAHMSALSHNQNTFLDGIDSLSEARLRRHKVTLANSHPIARPIKRPRFKRKTVLFYSMSNHSVSRACFFIPLVSVRKGPTASNRSCLETYRSNAWAVSAACVPSV